MLLYDMRHDGILMGIGHHCPVNWFELRLQCSSRNYQAKQRTGISWQIPVSYVMYWCQLHITYVNKSNSYLSRLTWLVHCLLHSSFPAKSTKMPTTDGHNLTFPRALFHAMLMVISDTCPLFCSLCAMHSPWSLYGQQKWPHANHRTNNGIS